MVLRWGTPRTPSGQAADSSSIDGKGFSSDRSWCWRTRRCRRGLQWSLRCFPSGTRHSNVQVGNCRWTIVTPTTKTGADDQVTLHQKEATSFRNAFIEKDYQRRWFGARWWCPGPNSDKAHHYYQNPASYTHAMAGLLPQHDNTLLQGLPNDKKILMCVRQFDL